MEFTQVDTHYAKNIFLNEKGERYRCCTKCEGFKPDEVDYFRLRDGKTLGVCRICEKKINNEYAAKKQIETTKKLCEKYSVGDFRCLDPNHQRSRFMGKDGLIYRRCGKKDCQKILLEEEHFSPKIRDGKEQRRNYCKECINKDAREYHKNNPEYSKEYWQREDVKERAKIRRKERLETDPEYREKRRIASNKSINKHKEKRRLKRQTPEFKEKRRLRKKKKRAEDKSFKMMENMSNAILKALKKGKSDKAGQSIMQHLGYTRSECRAHIESQFDEKMSWQNYGEYWHLDHKIPQSDLPFSSMTDENFKICWGLANLRPLEAKQNMRDGATRVRHKKK